MMLIQERQGNLFDYDGLVIGHGVNCHGFMGGGIASSFKSRYPSMYYQYRDLCSNRSLKPGGLFWWYDGNAEQFILNLATQDAPGANAQYSHIKHTLFNVGNFLYQGDINEFAIPKIGCGIGGLDWVTVKEVIQESSYDNITAVVYSLEDV